MTEDIKEFMGPNRFLSNFWPCPILFEDIVYPSVEHAYQAAKTLDIEQRKLFINCSAGQSKRLGKKNTLRDDWEEVKYDIMRDLVFQKFSIPAMQFQLENTGNVQIIEGNTWGDTYWGVCKGVGQNILGQILMEVRSTY